jgi:hypothetical protein
MMKITINMNNGKVRFSTPGMKIGRVIFSTPGMKTGFLAYFSTRNGAFNLKI